MKRIVTAALQFSVEPMAVERNLQRAYELLCQCHETTPLLGQHNAEVWAHGWADPARRSPR